MADTGVAQQMQYMYANSYPPPHHHPTMPINPGFDAMHTFAAEVADSAMQNPDLLSPQILESNGDMHFNDGFDYDDTNDTDEKALNILDSRFSGTFFHISPRMQSLMEYFDRNVCPYLVAFDGPDNPYRNHILQLAHQSPGLQNAIAALAINNFRMRHEVTPQRMGFIEDNSEGGIVSVIKAKTDPSPEEVIYKKLSIGLLNKRLKDNGAAQDDSVLATILILCLFNVCDAGFSKFTTQLEGMQKLLSLRHGRESDFTRLVQMFFVWFDTMTSTVNDREMQIRGDQPLDLLNYATNLGALEQFSGCDGRLFKLIARLGRLNLLAQGRPVKPLTPMQAVTRTTTTASSDHSFPDSRTEFWQEYHDIRSRLSSWQPTTTEPSPLITEPTASTHDVTSDDFRHINEGFRHAALLYTARLAGPCLPRADPRLAEHVREGLRHMETLPLTSPVNKFLLWPLFIIGTECVRRRDREVVRSRCVELSKESGFYNNLVGLEVLERVWREVDGEVEGRGEGEGVEEEREVRWRREGVERDGREGRGPQAFRWRKAMDRVDGEYIVI